MFNRKSYKEIAKKQLKGRYTTPVLVTLVIALITAVLGLPGFIEAFKSGSYNAITSHNGFYFSSEYTAPETYSLLITLITLFITGVLEIAETNLYVTLSRTTEKISFSTFIKGFSLWLKGFLGYLWMALWIFLWSLLFFIPGIVKSFSYSQMFFILVEHPNVGVRKAMRLSKEMTRGFKGDLFVMYLSFIGWNILALCTCGILYLWLIPYQNMAFTNAYHALKARAINTNVLHAEDFETN